VPDAPAGLYAPLPRPATAPRRPGPGGPGGPGGGDAESTRLLPIVRPAVPVTGAGAVRGRASRLADRVPLAAVYVLVVTIVLFQRIVVPGTAVSVALPVAFLVLVGLAARRQLVADVSRTALYFAFVAAALVATVVASGGEGSPPSIASLLLLLVLYIPLCFRARRELREQFPRVLAFFQRVMVVAAVLCVLQTAIQFAGVSYTDLFESVLPPALLAADYNTTYPIYYGSSILKSNGFVFLEPSFASQFLAIAIVVHLLIGGPRWRLVLFGVALAATVSGTGIALLGVGLVVLAVRRGGRWTARALTASLFVVVVVALTPLGALLGERVGESDDAGSSGNARFVAPYVSVADAIGRDEQVFLAGRGAGTVDVDTAFFNPQGLLVNYPALPKFVGEYGVPAALVFLAFVLTVLLRNVPSPTLGLMAAALYFVLSGSLLQPQTVFLCWLLTGLFAGGRAGEVAGRRIRLSGADRADERAGGPVPPLRGRPAGRPVGPLGPPTVPPQPVAAPRPTPARPPVPAGTRGAASAYGELPTTVVPAVRPRSAQPPPR
jgi:hypothetical protein